MSNMVARYMVPLFLPALLLAGCAEEPSTPTSTREAVRAAPASGLASVGGVGIATALPLPINDTFANASTVNAVFEITNTGGGPAGSFRNSSTTNSSVALRASTVGPGSAGAFDASGIGLALSTVSNGGVAFDAHANSGFMAANLVNTGGGSAAVVSGGGTGASGQPALAVSNPNSGGRGLTVAGSANFTGPLSITNTSLSVTRTGVTVSSTGNTALRLTTTGSNDGLRISTPVGRVGLSVTGGSKNAVVPTSSGARLLHAEEAAEVWFADYGFGQAEGGRVRISIDPTFAETVRLDLPYHVFLQPYGAAELYVARRTPTGFEVVVKSGDQHAEFSWRIVASRRGFEGHRLDRAPWADGDPNLR